MPVGKKTNKKTGNSGLLYRFYFVNRKSLLSFNCKFADGVEEVFPLLFLGAQTLFVLVEPAAQSSGLLGSKIQGLVLLTLKKK